MLHFEGQLKNKGLFQTAKESLQVIVDKSLQTTVPPLETLIYAYLSGCSLLSGDIGDNSFPSHF
jgi:hypothetical protein